MKKKGLIISTVVMVVVLIASLTTATYAWFTTSASTSIKGFDVSVVSDNIMNIGLNAQGYTSYRPDATPDNFVSGACQYVSDPASGKFAGGYWTGEVGTLGSTITHDINWNEQKKAVGFSSDATVAEAAKNATFNNTKLITQPNWTHVVKANGDATKFTGEAEYAVANGSTTNTTQGDYIYMFLGAQATKKIQDDTNFLYVVIQSQGAGVTNGIAAAIHVAYRVNGKTTLGATTDTWNDVDYSKVATNNHGKFSQTRAENKAMIYGDYSKADGFQGATYSKDDNKTTFTGAVVVPIKLSNWNETTGAALDQIELVIYLAGADEDCVDAAKNGAVKIGLFFGAQAATTVGA